MIRLALQCLVACLLATAVGYGAAAPVAPDAPVTVKIIALSDFHGAINPPASHTVVSDPEHPDRTLSLPTGGIEYLSTLIAELKARNPLNAVVATGDLIGGSPLVSALFHDEPTIELLGLAGLEFSAVGNHEFDAGREELLRKQHGGCISSGRDRYSCRNGRFAGARFRYLAANVVDSTTGKQLLPPYAVKEFARAGGEPLAIAFVGLVLSDTPNRVVAAGTAELSFEDEASAANATVAALQARGIQTIIALIHEGGTTSNTQFDDA